MGFRFLRGDPKAVKLPATVTEPIAVGDACVLVSSKASPAAALGDSGSLAQNQEAAHDIFLGLSMDQKLDNDDRSVMIATEGVWEMDCTALGSAQDIGALVGLEGTGTALAVGVANQTAVIVATPNLAIGCLAEYAPIGTTKLKVSLAGVLTTTYKGCQVFAA